MLVILIALLALLIPILFGIYLMSKMRFLSTWLEAAALGIPTGIVLFTAFLFALYAIVGSLPIIIICLALAVFLLPMLVDVVLYHASKSNARAPKRAARSSHKKLELFGLSLNLLLTILLLCLIIWSIFLFSVTQSGNTVYCINAGCSDTLYHVGLGNSLIYTSFPPKYPFAIGTMNVYPFMNDFYSMLLNYLGFGLVASIIVPDLLLIFSFVTLSVLLAYRITKSAAATIASAAIFWFGGTGLMKIIDYPFVGYLSKYMQPIHLILTEYTPQAHTTILQFVSSMLQMSAIPITYWTTIINNMLIAQHDFMLGLPMGLLLIYLLYTFVFENKKPLKFGAPELVVIGMLAGLMPLVHPSTLLVLLVAGIFLVLYTALIKESRPNLLKWLLIIIPFILLATPELYYMNMQHRSSNWFFPNYGGFVINAAHSAVLTTLYTFINIVFFWIEAASLPIILAFAGLYIAKRNTRLIFIPFFLLLVMITFYSPMPNPADSNKIFLYVFLMLSILTGVFIEWLYKHKGIILKIIAIIVVLLITFNFVYVYISDITMSMQTLVSSAQMDAAKFILYNTPPNAIFAENGYNSFFNPIASTVGARITIISYNVYVGGIYKYQPNVLNDYNNDVFEDGSCSIINNFNVSYIYLQSPNTTSAHVFDNSNFTQIFYMRDNQDNQYIYIFKAHCG